jgi:hypothetical protein
MSYRFSRTGERTRIGPVSSLSLVVAVGLAVLSTILGALTAAGVAAAAHGLGVPWGPGITAQLRAEYERRLNVLRSGATDWEQKPADLRPAVIAHKSDTILHLRAQGIDDEVLREIPGNLDFEQLHTVRNQPS